MEEFFKTHAYLIEHTNAPVRRSLMDEIDWNSRMIGIKGTRGVGKTTFLLQYAKENFDTKDRQCLYVNMNNFYFQSRGISDFAGDFYHGGGRVLLIDQVFKQPDWSSELRKCYDNYPGLKIVFTGSSVMRLKEENPELNGIVKSYNLRGFSFREFINLMTGLNLPIYSLEDILHSHEQIEKNNTLTGKSDEILSGLYSPRILSFLSRASQLFGESAQNDEHDDRSGHSADKTDRPEISHQNKETVLSAGDGGTQNA